MTGWKDHLAEKMVEEESSGSSRNPTSARGSSARWLGRALAEFHDGSLELMAGECVPKLQIRLQAGVPQPAPKALSRTVHLTLYRMGASVDDSSAPRSSRAFANEASNGGGSASAAAKSQKVAQLVRSRTAPTLHVAPPVDDNGGVVLRKSVHDVPPTAGQRITLHDIDVGSIERAGRYAVQLTLEAIRHSMAGTVALATPTFDHAPLDFVVKPNLADPTQCKVRLMGPPGTAEAAAKDDPLVVRAGELIRVCIMTRDRFHNPTALGATGSVTTVLSIDGNGEAGRPQPSARQGESKEAEYVGGGVHESDYVRERAGRYTAVACLKGMPIGGPAQAIVVKHATVHPPSCKCVEVPQEVVDPRAIKAAIERDRIERASKAKGDACDTGCAKEHSIDAAVQVVCIPEGRIGSIRLTAEDSYGNRCNGDTINWLVTLRAEESWIPITSGDTKSASPPNPSAPSPRSKGEAWVEPASQPGLYMVRFRGLAGRYQLHVGIEDGESCAGSPFDVLIVPPAGGPATARPHGSGVRHAVAGDWTSFLLRPAEFAGCEPRPCETSYHLFENLRVSIIRRGAVPPWPFTRQSRTPLPQHSQEDPASARLQLAVPTPHRGETLPQPPAQPPQQDDAFSWAKPSVRRKGRAAVIEKVYGDAARTAVVLSQDSGGGSSGRPASPNASGAASRRRHAKGTKSAAPPSFEPGGHLIRYNVKEAGEHELYIAYGRVEIEGSPYPLRVEPAPISPAHSEVVGLAEARGEMSAGEQLSGAILLADRCGNPIPISPGVLGVPLRVVVEPLAPSLDPLGLKDQGGEARLVDLQETSCELAAEEDEGPMSIPRLGARFSFSLRTAGWYRVTVTVNDAPVGLPHGSYPILVHPLKPDLGNSLFDKSSLEKPLLGGRRVVTVATLRDRYGNVCATGGHELRATVRSPSEPLHTARSVAFAPKHVPQHGLVVHDRRDGSYEVSFTPASLGMHSLALAMVDGADAAIIGGAPVPFDVVPGLTSPVHCVASGDGIRSAWAGALTSFIVEARDAASNLATERPLSLRLIFLPASNLQYYNFKPAGDGRYKVSYLLPVSGSYTMSVLVGQNGSVRPADQRHVRGSPFSLSVHGSSQAKPSAGSMSSPGFASPRRPHSARGARSPRASPVSAGSRRVATTPRTGGVAPSGEGQ